MMTIKYMRNNKNQKIAVMQRQGLKLPLKPKEEEEHLSVLHCFNLCVPSPLYLCLCILNKLRPRFKWL